MNLRAEDAEGNCSYQITLFSYNAVGDETGAPYNIIYALSPAADGKTITWMSDPRHSAAAAVAELSTSADLSEATQIEGTSRLISYSGSKQINRVNGVTLSGLTAGATYYYRVGDGTVWSAIRSFTVPAASSCWRTFRRRPPLRAWSASPIIWPGSIPSAFSSATPWTMSATTTSGTTH